MVAAKDSWLILALDLTPVVYQKSADKNCTGDLGSISFIQWNSNPEFKFEQTYKRQLIIMLKIPQAILFWRINRVGSLKRVDLP